jgi:hypothetical protein
MMRRHIRVLGLLLGLGMMLGCQAPEEPVRRDILGSWTSQSFGDVTIRMTVAETAREVDGAGIWITATKGYAFVVTGALARDEVSLHFDFDERQDVAFHGFFRDEDRMEGLLSGGEYRATPITFLRQGLDR